MSGAERYLEAEQAEALNRLRGERPTPFLACGPVLEIAFPAANTRRDVQHGLGVIPTGFAVIAAQGGTVQVFDLANWTADLAFLSATSANTRARGFFVLTEVPTNA